MVQRSPGSASSAEGRPLRQLPDAADMPVIVATRLSLSFPVLISAVPLYAVDYGRPKAARRGPERCWFSDGGITSNFPVHFFDALVPRWPTFAINLRPFTTDYPQDPTDERKNIYMVRTNGAGLSEWWDRFDRDPATDVPFSGLRCVGGFLAAIIGSARNWRDNVNTRMPGYRDRIVHVKLDEHREGGLNLDMPPDVIARLTRRGEAAGALAARRYTTGEPGVDVSWPNHRWVRYRNAMAMLQTTLRSMSGVLREHTIPAMDYRTLIARKPGEPPRSYAWTDEQRRAGPLEATDGLCAAIDGWERDRMQFGSNAPEPAPELRPAPRL